MEGVLGVIILLKNNICLRFAIILQAGFKVFIQNLYIKLLIHSPINSASIAHSIPQYALLHHYTTTTKFHSFSTNLSSSFFPAFFQVHFLLSDHKQLILVLSDQKTFFHSSIVQFLYLSTNSNFTCLCIFFKAGFFFFTTALKSASFNSLATVLTETNWLITGSRDLIICTAVLVLSEVIRQIASWMLVGESLAGQPSINLDKLGQCLEHSLKIILLWILVENEILSVEIPLLRKNKK